MKFAADSTKHAFPSLGHSVLLVLGALAVQVVCGIIIAVFSLVLLGGMGSGMSVLLNPWTLIGVNCLAVGAMLKLGLRSTREPWKYFLRIRPFAPGLLPSIALASVGLAVMLAETDNVILEFLRFFPKAGGAAPDWLDPQASPVGAFWLLVIVAPLTEEYLFRGLILRGLLTRHRAATAILLSALLFGVMHANLRQLFLGVVIGSVFGWWYMRTRSVGPGLLGHALFNSVAFATALFPEALHPFVNNPPGGPIVHQPGWFTAAGMAALGLGLWWFDRQALPPPADELPPVLPEIEPPLLATTPSPAPAEPAAETAQPADSPAS